MKQAMQLKAISFLDILSATVFTYQRRVETLLVLRAVLRILNKSGSCALFKLSRNGVLSYNKRNSAKKENVGLPAVAGILSLRISSIVGIYGNWVGWWLRSIFHLGSERNNKVRSTTNRVSCELRHFRTTSRLVK